MQPHISGTTRLYGLVGDPLSAAKSPQLLNRLFVEQCTDAVCVPFWVKPDSLPAFAAGARAMGNLSGMLVTMPHKQRMLAFVDELDSTCSSRRRAQRVRAEAVAGRIGTADAQNVANQAHK
jgi:shikimate dehydrogenase